MNLKFTQESNNFLKLIKIISFFMIANFTISGCLSPLSEKRDLPVAVEQNITSDYTEGVVPHITQDVLMPYYVESGDSLSKIAKKIYGDFTHWKELAELNKLVDPNKIYAGDVIFYHITEKSKMFSEVYENAPRSFLTVKKGDSLYYLAHVAFGQSKNWRILWKENPQIQNPDELEIGMIISFRTKGVTAQHFHFKEPLSAFKGKSFENQKYSEYL
jgi:hypothetical protein